MISDFLILLDFRSFLFSEFSECSELATSLGITHDFTIGLHRYSKIYLLDRSRRSQKSYDLSFIAEFGLSRKKQNSSTLDFAALHIFLLLLTVWTISSPKMLGGQHIKNAYILNSFNCVSLGAKIAHKSLRG